MSSMDDLYTTIDPQYRNINNVEKRPANSSSPGPKYKLKPTVGYKNHCQSKVREPAYTLRTKQASTNPCIGPGPKYYYTFPSETGYTLPKAKYQTKLPCTPGPYELPQEKPNPAFSIVPRRPGPSPLCTPGPYKLPEFKCCHKTVIGIKTKSGGCQFDPAIRDIRPCINKVKPEPPKYSIGMKTKGSSNCVGPGPKYYPRPLYKPPEYSFGLKHHEKSPPFKTDADEKY